MSFHHTSIEFKIYGGRGSRVGGVGGGEEEEEEEEH
jgi:hypothetical protein